VIRPRSRRPRRTLPRPVGLTIVAVVGLVLLSVVLLVGFRLFRHGSLPGIVVAGQDAGALSDEELREAVAALEEERRSDRLVFRRPSSGAAPAVTHATTGVALGYTLDVEETARRVLERGRQGNPFAALADQLRATFGTIEIEPADSFESDEQTPPTVELARRLSAPPFFGGVAFVKRDVEPRYPDAGVVVSEAELVEAALPAAREPGGDEVLVKGVAVDPPTTQADVDALVNQARRAIDGPVELTLPGRSVTFTPAQLASAIETKVSGSGEDVELSLHIPPPRVKEAIGDRLEELEKPPVDARFEAVGDSVRVVGAQPGFELNPNLTAGQLLDVALKRGRAKAPLKGKKEPADFTTADAKALGIKERVSTFTTYHPCCEARVENIHRIAEIVDGAVVEPGDSFSLNAFVGPRTTANGFVGAPAIRDGKFVEEVGGGISQFATTMFNAIFFGGYDFLEYQPHSYYISRYPPGREATISTPAPDLAFLNDSNAGVYIDTSYTSEAITVSFYGSQNFDVDASEGPRKNVTPPKTQCRENDSLARGEERVIQEGLTGFDIVVTRVFSDGRPDEHFTTHYDMQPRIVERPKCERKN